MGEFDSDSDSDMSESEEGEETILEQYERIKKERRRRKKENGRIRGRRRIFLAKEMVSKNSFSESVCQGDKNKKRILQ